MNSGDALPRPTPAAVKWLLIGILSMPGLTWLATAGDPLDYWRYDVAAGQFMYLTSKLMGLYALVAFWLQLIYGLLGSSGRKALGVELGNRFHRRLGMIVAALMVAHIALFVIAASVRAEHFASQYLVPNFSHGYYRTIITLGLFGAILIVIGILLAIGRRWLVHWRIGHWLLIPSYILVFVHSLLIGSESRIAPMTVLYVLMALSVITAAAVRFGILRISLTRAVSHDGAGPSRQE